MRLRPPLSLATPAVPLAGILVLAFAASGLHTEPTDWGLVAADLSAAAALLALAALAPWPRLPAAALLALPVGADGVIAGLRHAQGGSTSGYSPLAILPVVWVALALGRRAVAAITACTAALFAVPIAIAGAPMYPTTGWRGVVLWTIVAGTVGVASNRVMARQRSRADELRRLVATQTAIATSALDSEATMTTVAEEALRLTGADAAAVALPEGDELVYRAAAGTAAPRPGTRLGREASLSGLALRLNRVLVCDDAETDPRVDPVAARAAGARSLLVVPLHRAGRATGVLEVSSRRAAAFGDTKALELLASMIGAALDRADLMERLSAQARTDELTGLLNRRAWYEHLGLAIARARRSGSPLSVIAIDLNGLKQVNDRDGHAAGDRLLRAVSAHWAAALRGSDVLGRLGGDEFGVVVEGADELGASYVLARLAEAILDDGTASAGIATWDGAEDASTLVSRADAEMYSHKRRLTAAR